MLFGCVDSLIEILDLRFCSCETLIFAHCHHLIRVLMSGLLFVFITSDLLFVDRRIGRNGLISDRKLGSGSCRTESGVVGNDEMGNIA